MKKLLVISVIALALVFTLSSASVYAKGLTGIGVKAGLNLANAYGDDAKPLMAYAALTGFGMPEEEAALWAYDVDVSKKMRIGAAFGGFIEYSINDNFAIQPEFLYTMKGVKGEFEEEDPYTGETVKVKGTIKLNYLEIPVLAKLSIPTQGSIKPVFLLGPALALKLSAKTKGEAKGETIDESGSEDISSDVKDFDFGVVVGAGVDYELASGGKVTVDGRYTLGLTNVSDIEGAEEDLDAKNAVISVMIGYLFPLK